jgi:hypothetical protein
MASWRTRLRFGQAAPHNRAWHGKAESAAVYGPAGPVEGTDRGKVIDIRPVAGGEDNRVDLLRGSVGPDPVGREAFEHPSFVGPASRDRGGVASVVEDSAPVRGAPTER